MKRSSVSLPDRRPPVAALLILAGIFGATAFLLGSCSQKVDPFLLARVGARELRVEQFQEQWSRRGGAQPETLDRAALLEEMIEQEVLYVRALQAGLDKSPELQRAWRNLLVGKLKERELAPLLARAEVTPAELKMAYESERGKFSRPAAARLAVLYLPVDSTMKPEKVELLQQRLAQARQKALDPGAGDAPGFGALAISYSEDQATRYHGGIIGWVEPDRGPSWLGRAAVAAGFVLKNPGDITEVVTDDHGVYLVKLMERREATVQPIAQVEAILRPRLLAEKRRQIERAFVLESRAAVPVETHAELLARIPAPRAAGVADNQKPPSFP